MPFVAVLALLLLLIAAIGQSWWWRTADWYGGAALYWGLFWLAVYLTWPTIRALL